jgi:pyrophosphatase PpaX
MEHEPLEAILFDLDGTLLDSVPLILDSFRHAFAAVGEQLPPPAELARAIGIPLRSFFGSLGTSASQVEALVAAYRAYTLAHHDTRVGAFPGVVETVGEVRRRGLRTALVTSKSGPTARRGLEVTGLADAMDVVVSCDDVTRPKPDPEPALQAVERLGVLARRAVFVGDSLHDLHSGRAAGLRTAAALWGPFSRADLAAGEPDYWLDAPADLLRLLPVCLEGPASG